MEVFLRQVKSIIDLSEESERMLVAKMRLINLNKKEILLGEGEICNDLFFLQKGLVRTFSYVNSKEVTEDFATEKMFFTSWESFIKKNPGLLVIEALIPSAVYALDYNDLKELSANYSDINTLYHEIKNNTILCKIDAIRALNTMNATERYQDFISSHIQVIQTAPLIYIASYLGITPETLSRIRCNQFADRISISANLY